MLILILSIVALGIFAALYSLLSSRGKHDDANKGGTDMCHL